MPVFRLSDAERRVAELVARGLRNEEVAKELGISVNTVRTHLRVVFDKLHLTHRGQLRARLGR
jgi:DNA-binding CsgD family transcriptional regulator